MNIRQKTVFHTMLAFTVLVVLFISFALNSFHQAQENERIERGHQMASMIASIIEIPLKNNNIDSIPALAERFVANGDIAFLHLSYDGKEQRYNSPNSLPDEIVTISKQHLTISGKKIGNVTLGYRSIDVNIAHFSAEQFVISRVAVMVTIAILAMFLMLILVTRPLNKLLRSHQQTRSDDEQNRAIYDASHDAIIIINDQGIIIEFSPVAEQLFDWDREEVMGKTMTDTLVPERLREAHINGMKHFLLTGKGPSLNKRIELTAIRRNGNEFPIEISISAAKTVKGHIFVAYIRDITERVNDQTELTLAAHAFETSEAMFIADNKGHIIRINPGFTAVTGYSQKEVAGTKPRTLMANQQDTEFQKQAWRDLNEKGIWNSELNLRHRQGHQLPVHMSMTAVTDENGILSHFVAHFFDLSEQKQTEQILRETQCAAELANQSKSRFLASMSHEIRTPMNGVIGVLGLLKETPLNNQQQHLVQAARDSGEHLIAIINDILDFSKMEAGKLMLEENPFDLHWLLNQTVNIMHAQAEHKKLVLTANINQDTPRYVVGDGDRIRQILINLLSNAIKYTTTGHISVSLRCNGIQDDAALIQIDVQDTGIGIAFNQLSHLFDEFTMVENSYDRTQEGSGLGLAICKQLINLMDGTLGVQSELGHGSTFTISFTQKLAQQQDVIPALVETAHVEHTISKELRILMAEDNPANQVVLRTMLEFSGLSVDIVGNGKEAVEAVRQFPYDIVFMDISMPEVDGIEATKRIRALDGPEKNIIIVALTAHAIQGDKEHFLASGMDDFISKPVTRNGILDCLARWQPNIQKSPKYHAKEITPKSTRLVDTPTVKISRENTPANLISFSLHQDNAAQGYTSQGYAAREGAAQGGISQNITSIASVSQHNVEGKLVDEATLNQLVNDTSAEVVPELIEFYLIDAQKRLSLIKEAADKQDFYALEFETHTLGSSAAAHGNTALGAACRRIELHCKQQQFDQALAQSVLLQQTASDSFTALKVRIEQGFTG